MNDFFENEASILELVDGFRNKNLLESQWTHEAHLAVGIWFLSHYDRYEATCLLRSGIIELNVSLGGKNTEISGYHETITLLWIWMIDKFLKANEGMPLTDLCNAFLKTEFSDRNMLLKFYSKEVLFSTRARAIWVEPDRRLLTSPF
ncbi:MAG: hypothetical protein KDC85_09980 [Saprospiraceae bacterium]|nr:hypothetical protein [Saprospiraceae bacterium]MCB9323286.1 hypothetical protein [Lewinellaceae bacterium]